MDLADFFCFEDFFWLELTFSTVVVYCTVINKKKVRRETPSTQKDTHARIKINHDLNNDTKVEKDNKKHKHMDVIFLLMDHLVCPAIFTDHQPNCQI